MKRVMVLGCCGAGKSTFSRNLHAVTRLELFHLDQYYWRPNWVEPSLDEWDVIVQKLADNPAWIIDGNYGSAMHITIEKADTILYLDRPTWLCLYRAIMRIIKYWGRERPDMPQGCKERFDLEFLHYVATFNLVKRKKILKKLDAVKDIKTIVFFKSDKQANEFLNKLNQL